MRVEESIEIAAPRERVWAQVSEPARYERFMVGSSWEAVAGEPSSGLRARFRLHAKVGSIDLGGVVELIEFEPPHTLAWTSVSGIENRGRWILRNRGGKTEVTMRLSYQVPGGLLALLASRLGAPTMRADVHESLTALKQVVERKAGAAAS